MGDQPKVIIRGIPHIPSIVEINVRSGPGTNHGIAFKAAVGLKVNEILEVAPDAESNALNDKVYQWFKLRFPDGIVGWARDDLLEIKGDFTAFGYEVYSERTFAFDLVRNVDVVTESTSTSVETPSGTSTTTPATQGSATHASDLERVRRAAFAITEVFEGGHGYASYQNYDSGVISYGRFQFTLDAGSLGTVVSRFLERSNSPVANELRNYQQRIVSRDHSLRNDGRLKELLLAASTEDEMKRVQNEIATEAYWNRMLEISAQPRGVQSPLGLALLFDIAINFGVMNALLGLAEQELGVPAKSRIGENGVTEEQFIAQVADRRKRGHYAQAERDNLPGLKVRGDFWVDLVASGDWGLQGDANGNVSVKGIPVQVKNPSEF